MRMSRMSGNLVDSATALEAFDTMILRLIKSKTHGRDPASGAGSLSDHQPATSIGDSGNLDWGSVNGTAQAYGRRPFPGQTSGDPSGQR